MAWIDTFERFDKIMSKPCIELSFAQFDVLGFKNELKKLQNEIVLLKRKIPILSSS